jgi:hypothetical protein
VARPSLFIRPLQQAEIEHLARFRTSGRQAVHQHAQILLASLAYTPVAQIAGWRASILFVCTHTSARSQLAEALLRTIPSCQRAFLLFMWKRHHGESPES